MSRHFFPWVMEDVAFWFTVSAIVWWLGQYGFTHDSKTWGHGDTEHWTQRSLLVVLSNAYLEVKTKTKEAHKFGSHSEFPVLYLFSSHHLGDDSLFIFRLIYLPFSKVSGKFHCYLWYFEAHSWFFDSAFHWIG